MDTTPILGDRLHERLRSARQRAGLSIRRAAQRLDVTDQAWSAWELGRASPRADRLVDIAQILGCAAADLLPQAPAQAPPG